MLCLTKLSVIAHTANIFLMVCVETSDRSNTGVQYFSFNSLKSLVYLKVCWSKVILSILQTSEGLI